MSITHDHICTTCGAPDETTQLERCVICLRYFCIECAHRGTGRRFCSMNCADTFFHLGDDEDDQDSLLDSE